MKNAAPPDALHDAESALGESEPWEPWETKLVLWSVGAGLALLAALGFFVNITILPG